MFHYFWHAPPSAPLILFPPLALRVGASFEEIAEIIAGVTDKARVGVCIDTAHVHGAGYDIRTQSGWDAMMDRFNAVVGLQYLRGIHVNDSKVELGSRVDRHAPIGRGRVGIEGFRALSACWHRAGTMQTTFL